MHVLLIHQAFVSPQEAGGTRHFEFARSIVEQGHEFTIVASDISYLSGQKVVEHHGLIAKQAIEGVRILRAYTVPSLHRGFIWRIVSFLSFMCASFLAAIRVKNIDLIMGTSPPIFQAFSAWAVAFLRRRPFLLEVRDLWPEFAIDIGILRNKFLIQLSRWLEKFLYNRAIHIVVNSPAYREYLIQKGIQENKISLVANGVDPTMFCPDVDGQWIRQGLNLGKKFVVTYAGALGLANDIPTILRAAERLKSDSNIHFVLVGDGKERSNLEELARELKLSNVSFFGSYPKSEMPAILSASNACMATLKDIPMFRTTYPNKVFDYMAAGRPTILVIDGVIRKVVEDAHGGVFVPPGDDAALARAVRYLAENPEEARRMGNSARIYVEKHFNRRDHVRAFVELAERLATNKALF